MTRIEALQFLNHRLGPQFIPQSPADFIGTARTFAERIDQKVADAEALGRPPLALLINGLPGTGKSMLAAYTMHKLKVQRWSATRLSGTSVKLETVEEMARNLRLRDMFGSWRGIWIDEADKIPPIAQVRFLLMLDELPNGTAVLCTSNCELTDFEERFQGRFEPMEITAASKAGRKGYAAASAAQIAALLKDLPLPKAELSKIAEFACGNVRTALIDARNALGAPEASLAA